MHTPVHVRAGPLVETGHRVQNGPRLLGRRRVVEVNQWFVMNLPGKNRELAADRGEVRARAGAQAAGGRKSARLGAIHQGFLPHFSWCGTITRAAAAPAPGTRIPDRARRCRRGEGSPRGAAAPTTWPSAR